MAAVKTWEYSPSGSGNVIVHYTDGTMQVLTESEAISQKIIPPVKVMKTPGSTTKTTKPTSSYALTYGTAITDPFTNQMSNTGFAVPIAGKKEPVPIGILLKDANDPTKLGEIRSNLIKFGIISKGTKSQQSVINAYTSVLIKAAAVSMDPNVWMQKYKASGGGQDVTPGAAGGTTTNVRKFTAQTIQSQAEQIWLNRLGRKPTAPELKALAEQLTNQEMASPTKTTTDANGNVVTSGGVDEQAFMQKIADKDPSRVKMQNIQFGDWLTSAMTNSGASNLMNG